MDAPPSRYRIVEKDGRLIVIDNSTGKVASGTTQPRPGGSPIAGRPKTSAPGSGGSPISSPAGTLTAWRDGIGALLLRLTVSEWDENGLAIIHWSWKRNGVEQRWDAGLDEDEQRRLARALTALATLPLFLILLIFGGGGWLFVPLAFTVVPVAWGAIAIAKLRAETNQCGLPRE